MAHQAPRWVGHHLLPAAAKNIISTNSASLCLRLLVATFTERLQPRTLLSIFTSSQETRVERTPTRRALIMQSNSYETGLAFHKFRSGFLISQARTRRPSRAATCFWLPWQ